MANILIITYISAHVLLLFSWFTKNRVIPYFAIAFSCITLVVFLLRILSVLWYRFSAPGSSLGSWERIPSLWLLLLVISVFIHAAFVLFWEEVSSSGGSHGESSYKDYVKCSICGGNCLCGSIDGS